MKALSIKQPWASLIAHGIKDIENRTWKTKFRGRIYIHASGTGVPDFEFTREQHKALLNIDTENMSFHNSAIIGEVEIIDCVINHPSTWAEKTFMYEYDEQVGEKSIGKPIYNWVLANPVLYDKPILNVKGKLSFWEFEEPKSCYLFWFEDEGKDAFSFEIEAKDHEEAFDKAYETHGPQVHDMMYQLGQGLINRKLKNS